MSGSPSFLPEGKLYIVVDTNYFFSDLRLKHADWNELLKYQRLGKVQLCVPEVVVQEMVRHQSKKLRQDINNHINQLAAAEAALIEAGFALDKSDVTKLREQRDELCEPAEYEGWLRERFVANSVETIPIPKVDAGLMFGSYIEGLKPFKSNGEGLADYLVWRSTVELASRLAVYDLLVLVTNNHKDFAEHGAIHPDLAASLPPGKLVGLSPDLRDLLEEYRPSLEAGIAPIEWSGEAEFADDAFDYYDDEYDVETMALSAARGYAEDTLLHQDIEWMEVEPYSLGLDIAGYDLPAELQNPYVAYVELDDGATWLSYDALDQTTVLGRLDTTGTMNIEAYMLKSDVSVAEGDNGIHVADWDHNDHMMLVSVERAIEIEFHVRVELGSHAEVINIERVTFPR